MHSDRSAEAYIAHAIAECGQDPAAYFVSAIADELHETHGTWNMDAINENDFWPVVAAYFAGDDTFMVCWDDYEGQVYAL